MQINKPLGLCGLGLVTGIALSSLLHLLAMQSSHWLGLLLLYLVLSGVMAVVLMPAIPIWGVLVCAWLMARFKGWPSQKSLGPVLTGLSILLLHGSASLGTTLGIDKAHSQAAEAFCEGLISQLEDYKNAHGRYPQDLESIQISRRLPYYLRGATTFYSRTSTGYEFAYSTPWMIAPGYTLYASSTGEWVYLD